MTSLTTLIAFAVLAHAPAPVGHTEPSRHFSGACGAFHQQLTLEPSGAFELLSFSDARPAAADTTRGSWEEYPGVLRLVSGEHEANYSAHPLPVSLGSQSGVALELTGQIHWLAPACVLIGSR